MVPQAEPNLRSEAVDETLAASDLVADMHREHYRSLVRLASLLLDDVGACEEVVQDAFVRFQLRGSRLRDAEKAPAYLRSIVLNGARSRLRRRQVAARHPDPMPSVVAGSPEDDAIAADRQRQVLVALRALPRRQREAVALRYYLDLSEAEMAASMGVSAGSVKTHLHRGMAALAESLGALGPESGQEGGTRRKEEQ